MSIAEINAPDGYPGTELTISEMWKLVNDASKDEGIIRMGQKIVKNIPAHDYKGEANAVFNFVKNYVRFLRDPDGVEKLASPWVTLRDRAGDCDDQSILTATLAKAIGFPVRFATIQSVRPGFWNHIYSEIMVGNDWYPADTTEGQAYFGWQPPARYGKKIWNNPLSE